MSVHAIPELDSNGLRRFALVTGTIVVVLFGLLFPWMLDLRIPVWPYVLGGVLALWGLVAPASLKPIYYGWMKFGLLLSRLTTPVVLGFVFYLVIFPIGIAMRLTGRDTMARRLDPGVESYRIPSAKPDKNKMERPF